MTVEELFDNFNNYFNRIYYTDKTNKIEGVEEFNLQQEDLFPTQIQFDKFINKYGKHKVIDWEFENSEENSIWIWISED